jgi:hypothetical protein
MPNQELIKTAASKYASMAWGDVGRSLLQGVGVGAGVLAVGALGEIISDKVKDIIHESKSSQYFEEMLEAHPSLKKEDPEEIAKYWASLYHFAPQMAQDPLAAGAYIKQSIARLSGEQFGGPPPETFNTLVDVQKKYTEGRGKPKESRIGSLQQVILSNAVSNAMNSAH